jgi:hypothetical protein
MRKPTPTPCWQLKKTVHQTGATSDFDVHDFPQNLTSDMRQRIRDRIQMLDTSVQRMPPAIYGDLSDSDKASILGALAP